MENRIWVIRGVANEPVTPGIAFIFLSISPWHLISNPVWHDVGEETRGRDWGATLQIFLLSVRTGMNA